MKMQENKLKKFNVYSKIANVLFIITLIFGSLAVLVSLGVGAYLTSIDFDFAGLANKLITEMAPELGFKLPDIAIPFSVIFMIIINMGLSFALSAYILKAIANLFKNIVVSETPFISKVSHGLKNIGIALFIYAGILFLLSILSGTVIPHPAQMTFDVNINGSSILFGLLLLALGEIFEYGVSLQQDSESIV